MSELVPAPATKSARRRGAVAIVASMLLLAALGSRVYQLKFNPPEQLLETRERQGPASVKLPARRGSIFDSEYRLLAGSVVRPAVFADPSVLQNLPEAARRVAPLLNKSPHEVEALIDGARRRDRRFVYLQRGSQAATAEAVRQLRIHGLGVINEPQRNYPQGTLAAHVLGFVGRDGTGLEGVELQYQRHLAGQQGSQQLVRDAARRTVRQLACGFQAPRNGLNLVLTIEAVLQHVTEEALGAACEKYRAKCGMAVVMDPRSGEILAMANWPTFDPNDFGSFEPDVRRNRSLTDPFEPGSTLKPMIASGAISLQTVTAEQRFDCHHGRIRLGNRTLHDHGEGFGVLGFDEVVIYSSNIGMALIGAEMGNANLYKTLEAFGFGQVSGINLPGENAGLLRSLSRWTSYSTSSIPMGQEVSCTALQLITAFAALANDGVLMYPRGVRGIVDDNGQIIEDCSKPVVRRRVLDEQTASYMVQHVMAEVINRGTGKPAALAGYQVFGKTGTAQLLEEDGTYSHEEFVGSFLAGLPANDPQLVALLSVYRPDKSIGYYGGTVAAPAVRQILESGAAYLEIPSDPTRSSRPAVAGGYGPGSQ